MWNQSCRYTVRISGIRSVDGASAPTESFSFFTPFKPMWGSIELIELDLRALLGTIPPEVIQMYAYQASLDAWRAIKRGKIWTPVPDVNYDLDQLLQNGTDEALVGYLDCYVRYRTQYLLLVSYFPFLASGGTGEKTLGDFKISYKGSVTDLKNALDSHIVPEMNACYWALSGEQKTKPAPRIVVRGASAEAVRRHKKARSYMPPGMSHRRNWDKW